MVELLNHIHLKDAADIAAFGLMLWGVIVWARRVHAILALLGLGFLALLYLIALQLELQLMTWFFQGFFAALVIFLVVVFQVDLRRLFERIALLGLRRRSRAPTDAGILIRSLDHMKKHRWGALIVIPKRDPIERHLQGGIELNAVPSEKLILSLLNTHSPGHDGAIIWHNNRIKRFGAHLPLSENRQELGPGGTRHAAALGLTERCDAICITLSEERGTISVAAAGELQVLANTEQLANTLEELLSEHTPPKRLNSKQILTRFLEFGMAFSLSLIAWAALIPGSDRSQTIRRASLSIQGLPTNCNLVSIDPDSISVRLAGPRRVLLITKDDPLVAKITVDADLVKIGRRTFEVKKEHLKYDPALDLLSFAPSKIFLYLRCEKDLP